MQNNKGLHPSNIHNKPYDFKSLVKTYEPLAKYVKLNQYDSLSIDFSDSQAVLNLNQALISHHYNVKGFSVLKGHLCPPIPGRADYIHYLADLLSEEFDGDIPVGPKIKGLDIGCGTSCIYPILGNSIYGWKFIASDISSAAINNANEILKQNSKLKKNIKLRFQESSENIFEDLIKSDEFFDFTMCNPPFYSSLEEANRASDKKIRNLNSNRDKKGHKKTHNSSNFGGVKAELWCDGGELTFIRNMITQSAQYKDQCNWFSTLISNKDNIPKLQKTLLETGQIQTRLIKMSQGSKVSHILAWNFEN
jgi:23S rRNA (adenine1618-N6)-methyltransferase